MEMVRYKKSVQYYGIRGLGCLRVKMTGTPFCALCAAVQNMPRSILEKLCISTSMLSCATVLPSLRLMILMEYLVMVPLGVANRWFPGDV